MPQPLNTARLDEALTLLAERLKLTAAEPEELVVCGGSSLIARGYVSRVTRDVDVVARRVRGADLVSARPLPPLLIEAAARVAVDLGLPARWLNDGPADLFEMGLPVGFVERLQSRTLRLAPDGLVHRPDRPNSLQALCGSRPRSGSACRRPARAKSD